MRLQVPNSVMFVDEEERAAMENRSKLRLVKPSGIPNTSNPAPLTVIPEKTDEKKAIEWLKNEFQSRYGHYRSQRSIFGVVTLSVPVKECKPEMVAAFLGANGVPVLSWKNVYCLSGIEGINERRELVSVELTFDTPEIGVLNMPI